MNAPAVDSAPLGRPLTEQIQRAQLWLENGYKPVPCLRHDAPATFIRNGKPVKNSPGKRPHPDLWRDKETAVYGATPDAIKGWRDLRNIGTYPNTGLACGWAVAADADVSEATLASATEALVCEHLGATPLRRVGQAPKVLLLYRAATESLNKAATAVFVNDAGQTAQLEIMGQGQQIVADGMHPCGTPYSWGEASPDDTPLAELPAVTAEQVALLIADAETLFLEHGYRPKGIEPPREAAAPSPSPKPRGTADPAGPFRAVNDAAMADLGRWVPQLFGDDAREDRHGGYRVSSAALGRDLEEDISISPKGIVDFGEHDMGDANLGKRTPIDLVIEHGDAADAKAAAKWLAGHLGTPFEIPQVDTRWEEADPHATGRARAKPNGADGEAHRTERDSSEAEPAAPSAPRLDITHDGLALDMGRTWADARHVALWGHWLFWAGSCWERDACLLHLTRCREYLRQKGDDLVRWAKAKNDEKLVDKCEAIAKQLRSAQMVANVVGLARSNPAQVATVDQWDADPFELGAPKPARTPP